MQKLKRRKAIEAVVSQVIKIKFTVPLTDSQYRQEVTAVLKEIKEGAREYAYSTELEQKSVHVKLKN